MIKIGLTLGGIMSVLLALFVVFNQAYASPYFTPLREDQNVPQECKDLRLGHFQWPAEKFYMGRDGAVGMGFTFEYPIQRGHATTLWYYFRGLVSGNPDSALLFKIENTPELKRDYEIILAHYQEQGFDFSSEGEILESLSIESLYQEFPENMYFITGGVEYHEEYSSQTIGELDVYIGRRDSCELVAVGEVKLGTGKTLNKARKQLERFENFLIDHDAPGFSGEYKPGRPRDFEKQPKAS